MAKGSKAPAVPAKGSKAPPFVKKGTPAKGKAPAGGGKKTGKC